jgi:hypothetical protein
VISSLVERASKVVYHTALEEGSEMALVQTGSLVLGLVLGLLEIVLSDTQQSRDGVEDIERAKDDSFDTGAGQLNVALTHSLLLSKPVVAVTHRRHRNGEVTSAVACFQALLYEAWPMKVFEWTRTLEHAGTALQYGKRDRFSCHYHELLHLSLHIVTYCIDCPKTTLRIAHLLTALAPGNKSLACNAGSYSISCQRCAARSHQRSIVSCSEKRRGVIYLRTASNSSSVQSLIHGRAGIWFKVTHHAKVAIYSSNGRFVTPALV